jgi:hypothetical protein
MGFECQVLLSYDYWQLYVYDRGRKRPDSGNEYLDALDAANESGQSVGVASGVVDMLMPRQDNFAAPAHLGIVAEPPPLLADADHVVEFSLTVPSGTVVFEGSGGSGEAEWTVPPGSYRIRVSGFEFDEASAWTYDDTGNPPDHYVVLAWRCDMAAPPSELLRWPGFDLRS